MNSYEEAEFEAESTLRSLAQYTRSKNATWRITDYNPIGCLGADIAEDKKDAVVCHTINAIGVTPEGSWNVDIMESIYLSSEKGDIAITLSDDLTQFDLILSSSEEYDDCTAESISSQFKDSPILMFAQIVLPVLTEAAAPIFDSYDWFSFHVPNDITRADMKSPVFQLSKHLANKHRITDFHKIVFDTDYREQLYRAELN